MNVKKLKQIGISHSKLSVFLGGCKLKFWYTLNNWYNPNSAVFKNALFGNLCHHISEKCQEDKSINAFVKLCRDYQQKNSAELTAVDPQDVENDIGLASITMHGYYDHRTQFYKDYTVIKNELYLKRLKVNGHVFNTKIDKVLQHKKTGEIWILDHKCKSRFNIDILTKKIRIDQQLQLYKKCFETAYHRKTAGVMWDIIRKSSLRMTKKDTGIDTFMERVKADIKKRPEWYFFLIQVRSNLLDTKSFDSDLDSTMGELYSCVEKGEKAFCKNTNVCEVPFLCDFLDACTSNSMNLYLQRYKK